MKNRLVNLLGKIIEIDYNKCGGYPVLKGTRIPVAMIVRLLELGWSEERIRREFLLPHELIDEVKRNFPLLLRLADALEFVEIRRDKLRGIPVVRDTRVPVKHIYDLMDNGWNIDKILREFPTLRRIDVEKIIEYRDVLEPIVRKMHEHVIERFHDELGKVV